MACLVNCLLSVVTMLRPVAHQPLVFAPKEYASLEDIEHARYLATTDFRIIDDERVIRCRVAVLKLFLPELAQYATVYFDIEENYWLVELETLRVPKEEILPLPDSIGGCPVYRKQAPVITTESFLSITGQATYMMGRERAWASCEGGHRDMTADEFLADPTDLCGLVKAVFPASIGIRLHLWHYIDILYVSEKALKKEAKYMMRHYRFPLEVCYMMYDLKVWDVKVELPGTTMVLFDPKMKRMEWIQWMVKARQYHRDMDNFVKEMETEIEKIKVEDFAGTPQGDTSVFGKYVEEVIACHLLALCLTDHP